MKFTLAGLALIAIGILVEVIIHLVDVDLLLSFQNAVTGEVAHNIIANGISALDMFGIVPAGIGIILLIYGIVENE